MESILEMEMTILGAATLQHGNGFCSKQQGKATVCYYLTTKSGKQHSYGQHKHRSTVHNTCL